MIADSTTAAADRAAIEALARADVRTALRFVRESVLHNDRNRDSVRVGPLVITATRIYHTRPMRYEWTYLYEAQHDDGRRADNTSSVALLSFLFARWGWDLGGRAVLKRAKEQGR